MKWVNVSNGYSGDQYELWKDDKKLVSLSISNHTKTTRIECADDKRLFFIEKKGFLNSRTVIKNEYGILVGEVLGETREAEKGIIEMDGKRYEYSINEKTNGELVISEENSDNPLVSCSLSSDNDEEAAVAKKFKSLHDTKYPCLLMALCWYLLKPAGKEMERVT